MKLVDDVKATESGSAGNHSMHFNNNGSITQPNSEVFHAPWDELFELRKRQLQNLSSLWATEERVLGSTLAEFKLFAQKIILHRKVRENRKRMEIVSIQLLDTLSEKEPVEVPPQVAREVLRFERDFQAFKRSLEKPGYQSQYSQLPQFYAPIVRLVDECLTTNLSALLAEKVKVKVAETLKVENLMEKALSSVFATTSVFLEDDDKAIVGKVYSTQTKVFWNSEKDSQDKILGDILRDYAEPIQIDIVFDAGPNVGLLSKEGYKRLDYNPLESKPSIAEFQFRVVAPGGSSIAISLFYQQNWLRTFHFNLDAVEVPKMYKADMQSSHNLGLQPPFDSSIFDS